MAYSRNLLILEIGTIMLVNSVGVDWSSKSIIHHIFGSPPLLAIMQLSYFE